MNINLLPQKFYVNRATSVIVLATGITLLIIGSFFIGIVFIFNQQQTRLSIDIQQSQVEQVTLKKQVSKLEAAQSKDIKEFLSTLKSERLLMSPLMAAFEKTASESNLSIIEYQIGVQNEDGQEMISEQGDSLLPTIKLSVRGDLFANLPLFKSGLEQLSWVYDVHPISSVSDGDQFSTEISVRLKNMMNEKVVE